VAPGKNQPFEMVELSTEARQGDSGGPIFNARGELAGVLLGAKRGHTVGSFCGRVGHFLNDVAQTLQEEQSERGPNRWVAVQPVPTSAVPPTPKQGLALSYVAAGAAESASFNSAVFDWRQNLTKYLGPTPFDQIKTFLATVGAFSLLISCLRLFKINRA
jgi:hypothetical protein